MSTDLLETIENLSRFHREHEEFYAQAPLEQAITLQRWSRSLKALADHRQQTEPVETRLANPYAGCDGLNVKAAIDGSGILFLEGEGEPAELATLKRELATTADGVAAVVLGDRTGTASAATTRRPARRAGTMSVSRGRARPLRPTNGAAPACSV